MAFDLEGLYRTTYDAVVRFLYRKVWDADRAEDLAQEVFMRALAHQPEKPRSWVFAVAANIARDEARAAIRRRKHLVLLTHEPIAAPAAQEDVEEGMDHAEQEAEVKRALATLTPRDREVLLLWDAGLSYPEIADQTASRSAPWGRRWRVRASGSLRRTTSWRNSAVNSARPHVPEEELHAYCDGELSPPQRIEIAEHLLGCLICRSHHAEVGEVRTRASALLAIAAPTRIRRPAVKSAEARDRAPSLPRAMTAAAAAIVGLGVWFSLQPDQADQPAAQLANTLGAPGLSGLLGLNDSDAGAGRATGAGNGRSHLGCSTCAPGARARSFSHRA